MMSEPLWKVEDLATYLGVPVQTIYAWNSRGLGPRYVKAGRHVRFRPEDVHAWEKTREHGPDAA
jgi:excisionase family DNA binding protein